MPKKESGAKISFENRLTRLQTIVAALEQGNGSLEESLALYREGLEHARACREEIAKARHEVEILNENVWDPFRPAPDSEDQAEQP